VIVHLASDSRRKCADACTSEKFFGSPKTFFWKSKNFFLEVEKKVFGCKKNFLEVKELVYFFLILEVRCTIICKSKLKKVK
jgi:hypothetical protein